MYKKLSWQAVSNNDRMEVIEVVKDLISAHDGCVMNFNMFSDVALSMSIELEENRVAGLHKELAAAVHLSELEATQVRADSTKECLIFLHVSFGTGKGTLKQVIPEIPG